MKIFNKYGISPLISWILMVGMMISIGTMVSLFLLNQAKETTSSFEESQYSKLYCPDVALDGRDLCYQTGSINGDWSVLKLSLKNRGSFTIKDIILTTKNTNKAETLKNIEGGTQRYEFNELTPGSENDLIFTAELLSIQMDSEDPTKIISHGLEEISITPIINIEGENTICNQKIFKLNVIGNSIESCS